LFEAAGDIPSDGVPIGFMENILDGTTDQFVDRVAELLGAKGVHGYDGAGCIEHEVHGRVVLEDGSPRDVAVYPLHRIGGGEGELPRQHFVKGDAQSIEIAAGVYGAVHPAGLFRRHVGERTRNHFRRRRGFVALKPEGADIFISITTPKFAAQSIKKVAELAWKPLFILNGVAASTGTVMKPAGLENGQNIISATYAKDPTDAQWKDDTGIKNFDAFLSRYFPEGNREDQNAMTGYNVAQTMVYVLEKCGDDLTRANIMKQAAGIKSLQLEGLLPGVTINTSATDFAPIKQFQLRKFKGERWELFGDVVSSEIDK
jgi:hypothetical protein